MRRLFSKLKQSRTVNSWLSLGARSLNLAILLPILVARLPAADVAVWYLLVSIIALLAVADMGLAPTFTRYIAYTRRSPGTPKRSVSPTEAHLDMPHLVRTMVLTYRAIAVTWFSISGIIGSLALVTPISATLNQHLMWSSWIVILFATTISLSGSVYSSILLGQDRIVELRRIEAVIWFLTSILSIVAFIIYPTVLSLAVTNALGLIFRTLLTYLYTKKHFAFSTAKTNLDYRKTLRAIWPSVWRSGTGVAMSTGTLHGLSILLAQHLPPPQLAAYLVSFRVLQAISDFSRAPFYSRLPQLASLFRSEAYPLLLSLSNRVMMLSSWTFVFGVATMGSLMPIVLGYLRAETQFIDHHIWLVMAVAIFAERFGAMHLQLYSLTNHILWHISNGITGAIIVLTAIILLPDFGTAAVPWALLIGNLGFYSWYSAFHSYRQYRLRIAFDVAPTLLPLLALLIYAYFTS